MPLQKVKPGDPLRIPADTFNSFIDAAADLRARQQSRLQERLGAVSDSGIVRVRNDSGADRDRFNVLVITGVVLSPTDNAQAFKNQTVFTAAAPTSPDDENMVVLQEPLKDNCIGRAIVAGVSIVQIAVQDSGDTYASLIAGDAAKLTSGTKGCARILYKESGTGIKWAVVQFPASAAGGSEFINALITAAEGSVPPYVYSAVEATLASNGTIVAKAGGRVFSANVRNVCETPTSQGVGKVPAGRPVRLWAEAGVYWFDQAWFRGSYG